MVEKGITRHIDHLKGYKDKYSVSLANSLPKEIWERADVVDISQFRNKKAYNGF